MKMINNYYYYVLDIETGVANLRNECNYIPALTWLAYGIIAKYDCNGKKIKMLMFREWSELYKYLDIINKSQYTSLIYCHNLQFEGDFLIKNISKVKNFCANDSHKFISLTLNDFENVEFRCSYALSGMSLRDLGKTVGLKKLEDDYYSYKPCDKIDKKSIEYCERDCDIVALYISKMIIKYNQLEKIPFSKTGIVRRKLREYYSCYEKDCKWDYYPDKNVYGLLNDSFVGGIACSNPKFTGIELKKVHSYDISSSYPFCLLYENFPRVFKHTNLKDFNEIKKYKHYVIRAEFKNLKTKYDWGWLSVSKTKIEDGVVASVFNGKIMYISKCVLCLCDVDIDNINMTYNYDDFKIIDCCVSEEDEKLPQCYIKTIEYYADAKYNAKKEYKQNKTAENYEKMVNAKSDFNSIYGMCVQKIVNEDFDIDAFGIWKRSDCEYKQLKKHLKRNFAFGVYTTAYARRNLLTAIVHNCPDNFVYCDTDSIKFIGKNEFYDTNGVLNEYKNNDAIYGLGRFEYEGYYQNFKTYGAKKYIYRKKGKVEHVVAGIPKEYKIKFEDFKLYTYYDKCKLAHVYISDDYNYVKITENGYEDERYNNKIKININAINEFKEKYKIKTKGGVALYETGYFLKMEENDLNYIAKIYGRVIE